MRSPIILSDFPMVAGMEILTAVLIIVITLGIVIVLYLNVRSEFRRAKEDRLNAKALKEMDSGNESDKQHLVTDRKVISKKSKDLIALIDQEIYQAKQGQVSALFFMDIDNFRSVSERHGDVAADKTIEELSNRLKKYGDKNSIAGRHESDALIYFLINAADNEIIVETAKNLLELVSQPLRAIEDILTTSIGIVLFPYDGITAMQMIKNAEIALYVAKKEGKNRFSMYSSELIEKEQFNINYYNEIKKAISNDEFLLYYQPIVDVRTGKLIGLESLLRWNHPTMGILSPGKFLNVMDLTGDITWFGNWGFEQIVSQYVTWKKTLQIKDVYISTNLSPKQLMMEGLAKQFYDIVKTYESDSESYCLEIIDYYTVIKNPVALHNLQDFRRFGFRIAMDDMGDQFEIIKDMPHLNASIVKISREDVIRYINQIEDADKIERVISVGIQKQKVIIAEGLEDASMVVKMSDLGVRFMQGYYFSQPKSSEEIVQIIRKVPWSVDQFNR
jgi:diguanylate cyclase (GGDEF)-like protein